MKFVSIHSHSTFSYGDGYGRPKEHVERVADLEMSALALTEHGNVSSHAQLEKAARKTGIKPIFGLEAYTAPADMVETKNRRKWHQTILAADPQGYRNLSALVTRSWAKDSYQWPTVLGAALQRHHKGLIVTSGCADSLLACTLLGGKGIPEPDRPNFEGALAVARRYKRLLGDRYYLEVQQFPELERTRILNPTYAEISKLTGIPLVATADVHYPLPEQNEIQKILHAASRNTGTVAAAEAEWEYNIRLTYPTSDRQLRERLEGTGLTRRQAIAAIESTAEIASRCNVELPKAERIRFPLEKFGWNGTAEELLTEWLRDGWTRRISMNPHMRKDRSHYLSEMQRQMKLVVLKGFVDYFLAVAEIVRWGKARGIFFGPARGSAAASLPLYILGVTEIDPLQYPTMIPERFIAPDRDDLPDVDIDVEDERRHELQEHCIEVYGADHVGTIGAFTRYRGKNSIEAVGRVHEVPAFEVDIVKRFLLERSAGDERQDNTIEDTRKMFPAVEAVFEKYPALALAQELEGNYKSFSVHAAGVVISSTPIAQTCATYTRHNVGKEKRTVEALAYDKKDAEHVGMLKLDLLGLSTMGMIAIAAREIGMTLEDVYRIPLDDPATLEAFRNADVVGVFQFEGGSTRAITRQVRPDKFMELADINALSRPGSLFSGATSNYIDVKHGRQKPQHFHEIVDNWTRHSHFQIVYQEQVLGVIREMGGFPAERISDVRRVIQLKEGGAAFNEMRQEFVDGAATLHGVNGDDAFKIWQQMVASAGYSFNVAHSVSYATVAFWCMWFKTHHASAFYMAQLRKIKSDKEGREKWRRHIRDAKRHDITVLPPDLDAGVTWSRKGDVVRAGFSQVPGIGEPTALDIIEFRETEMAGVRGAGGFTNWSDLILVNGIGPAKLETIVAWGTSDDPFGLDRTHQLLNEVRNAIRMGRLKVYPRPGIKSNALAELTEQTDVCWMGFGKKLLIRDYIEDQRAETGEDVETIKARMEHPDQSRSATIFAYDDEDEEVKLKFSRREYHRFAEILDGLALDDTQVLIAKGIRWVKSLGTVMFVNSLQVVNVNDGDTPDGDETEPE